MSQSTSLRELNDAMRQTVLPVTIFVGILTIMGFFGNVLVIFVFSRRYHMCNFRYFVLCLGILDFISSITTMPGEIVTQLHWYTYQWVVICKIKSFCNMFTVTGEAFTLLAIAVDRYRKVCRPLGRQIKPKMALLICGMIYFCSVIVSIPVPFFWGLHTANYTFQNETIRVSVCEKDERYVRSEKPFGYTICVMVILSISLISMLVLYIFVARKLLHDKKKYYGDNKPIGTYEKKSFPAAGASSDVFNSTSKTDASDTGYSSSGIRTGLKRSSTDDVNVEDSHVSTLSPHHRKDIDLCKSTKLTKAKKLRSLDRREMAARVRRKTMIMIVLTMIFIVTTLMYLICLSFIARSTAVLASLSNAMKSVYFFIFRLYFINHAINPIVYVLLDSHFRKILKGFFQSNRLGMSVPTIKVNQYP